MKYFLRRGERQNGPLSWKQVQDLAVGGKLRSTDELRDEGTDLWRPLCRVEGLTFGRSSAAPPAEGTAGQARNRVGHGEAMPPSPISARKDTPGTGISASTAADTAAVWWYKSGSEQCGPATVRELHAKIQAGELPTDSLVWRKGLASWLTADAIPEFAVEAAVRLPLPPKSADAEDSSSGKMPAFFSGLDDLMPSVGHRPSPQKGRGRKNTPAPGGKRLLSSLSEHVKEGGKVAAPVGVVFGFVGDVLTPLGPWVILMLVASALGSIALAVPLLKNMRAGADDWNRWLPEQIFVFSVFLLMASGVWFLLSLVADEGDRGVMASTIPGIHAIQESLLGLRQDVAAVKADTSAILRDTGEIKTELGKVGHGGIIKNPRTPADFFHNARFHEIEGNFREAFESYASYLGSNQEFVDPYMSYLELCRAQKGAAATRNDFDRLLRVYPRNRALAAVSLLQLSGEEKRAALEQFVKAHPSFGPALLFTADAFSSRELPEQSKAAADKESSYLRQFVGAYEEGHVQPYYLDTTMAIASVAEARGRLNISHNDGKTFTVTIETMGTGPQLVINDVHVRNVFYRFDREPWIQAPASAVRPVRSPIFSVTMVELDPETVTAFRERRLAERQNAEATLFVRYIDTAGNESAVVSVGPFSVKDLLANKIAMEKMTREVSEELSGINKDMKKDRKKLNDRLERDDLPVRIPEFNIPSF